MAAEWKEMPKPFFIAGKRVESHMARDIVNPHTGGLVASVCKPRAEHLEDALAAAAKGFQKTRGLRSHERSKICAAVAAGISRRAGEFAKTIAAEAGKPLKHARAEVERSISTFTFAAEEAKRIGGEMIPLDVTPASGDRYGITKRVPSGAVFAITPFNFPLNLVAHKVGPALACGCPIVVKPASRTPLASLMLAEVVAESGAPEGAFSVVPCSAEVADAFVPDERLAVLSFTGSAAVGWNLKSRAGRKRVTLELGGNAACVVDATADVDVAASRCAMGAFAYQGQVCISVQRILAHESVYGNFMKKFLKRIEGIRVGDPLDENTDFSAMISEAEAVRIEEWVNEALNSGARILCGGRRDGAVYYPTVLENVPDEAKISCEEAFGPVAVVSPFGDFDDAIHAVNKSKYGLQAGVFTNDLSHAQTAFDELEVGAVIINDAPTFRVDNMPYGGVKFSGFGREGVRHAIEEMTELRLCVMTRDV